MIDTSLASPDDIADVEQRFGVLGSTYVVNPHSIVMLHCLAQRRFAMMDFVDGSRATASEVKVRSSYACRYDQSRLAPAPLRRQQTQPCRLDE
jgi:hypothetical protein